jgi:hypothetical protein
MTVLHGAIRVSLTFGNVGRSAASALMRPGPISRTTRRLRERQSAQSFRLRFVPADDAGRPTAPSSKQAMVAAATTADKLQRRQPHTPNFPHP